MSKKMLYSNVDSHSYSSRFSANVVMSDTSSIGNYQCVICMCNYLCESHFMRHMQDHDDQDNSFVSEVEEEVADENPDDVDFVDTASKKKRLVTPKKRRQTVKTEVTVPCNVKPAIKPAVNDPTFKPVMMSPAYKPAVTSSASVKPAMISSAIKAAMTNSAVKSAATSSAYVQPAIVSPANTPVTSPAIIKPAATGPATMKPAVSSHASMKPTVISIPNFRPASPGGQLRGVLNPATFGTAVTSPDGGRTAMTNGYGEMTISNGSARTEMTTSSPRRVTAPTHSYSNGVASPIPSPQGSPASMPVSLLQERGGVKPKAQKHSMEAVCEMASNPRLTLTIKKSRASSYEVYQDQDSVMAVSPASQMREENCDVQSDSANETIDVESSSPEHYHSPGGQKTRPRTVNGRRKSTENFVCNICQKHYKSRYALKRHIATHNPERPFVCEFPNCDAAFKLKSRLSDHKRYVHKIKTPRTTGRSKSVSSPSVPAQVQPVLNTSYSFPGTCTAMPNPRLPGAVPSKVKEVVNSKPSPKEFRCTVPNCTRYFSNPGDLAIHLSMHTGLVNIDCVMCNYTTQSTTSLAEHIGTMHVSS